jgi:hypothetical protein
VANSSALYLLPAIFTIFPTLNAFPAEVTLAWDPNLELDVAGYKMYYGYASGDYPVAIDVGTQTTYILSDLPDGETYYLAVTAYDIYGNESDFSNEVVFDAPSDEIWDADSDGFELPDDCDDTNPNVNPDQEEVCGNGIDDNCNEETDETTCCAPSEESAGGWACGGAWNPSSCCSQKCGVYQSEAWDVFCIDDVSDLGPGACEWGGGWYVYNGYGNDTFICCNGVKAAGTSCDEDGDGFQVPEDCGDMNPFVNPGRNEVCGNLTDDNCNGEIDENCVLGDLDCDGAFTGTDVLIQSSLTVETIDWTALPLCIASSDGVLARSDWNCSGTIDGTDVLIGSSVLVDVVAEEDTPLGQGCW